MLCGVLRLALAAAALLAARATCPVYQLQVFSARASGPFSLRPIVTRFRAALGGRNNGNRRGPLTAGYRTISWDSPDIPFRMPGGYFVSTVPRGAEFRAAGGRFAVSNGEGDDRFGSVAPTIEYFLTRRYSASRLFVPRANNVVVVRFREPGRGNGAAAAAGVSGFGAVFSDVDLWKETFMVLYDRAGCLVGKVNVEAQDLGLSFKGVVVRKGGRRVAAVDKVAIRLGTVDLETLRRRHNGTWIGDFVMLDDLFYAEPQAYAS